MTCRQPSCFSQRSVSGFTSARFSESLGFHLSACGFAAVAAGAAANVAATERRNPRRCVRMVLSSRFCEASLNAVGYSRPVALGVHDTKETKRFCGRVAELVRLVRRHVDHVAEGEVLHHVTKLHLTASAKNDNDMLMCMLLV